MEEPSFSYGFPMAFLWFSTNQWEVSGLGLSDVHARRGAVGLAEGTAHAAGQTIRAGAGQGPRPIFKCPTKKHGK